MLTTLLVRRFSALEEKTKLISYTLRYSSRKFRKQKSPDRIKHYTRYRKKKIELHTLKADLYDNEFSKNHVTAWNLTTIVYYST